MFVTSPHLVSSEMSISYFIWRPEGQLFLSQRLGMIKTRVKNFSLFKKMFVKIFM